MYTQGQGVPQDYVQAAAWFRKAAGQGNAPAQAALGVMYVQAHMWLDLSASRATNPLRERDLRRLRAIARGRSMRLDGAVIRSALGIGGDGREAS